MRTPNRASVALAGLLIFAGTGCDILATAPGATPTPLPKATPSTQRLTAAVKRGTIIDAIKVLGRVVASQEADLSFRNSGRIREVYVQPGDLVQPGQVLAELDQRDLPWQLQKARVAVDTAQIKLAAAQAKDVVDDTNVDRVGIRAAELGVLQAQVGLERLMSSPLAPDLKKADADVASALASVDRARYDLAAKQADLAAKQAELAQAMLGPDPLAVLTAKSDVETTQIKLELAKAGPRVEDLKAAEITLDQERTKLDRQRSQGRTRPEVIEGARIDVEKARVGLAKVLADIDAGSIRGEESRTAAVQAAQVTLQQAQNAYDKVQNAGPDAQAIRQQERAVTLAELALARLRNQPAYDVETAQVNANAARARLDQLMAGQSEQELTTLRAQVEALERAVTSQVRNVAAADANLLAAQAKSSLVTRGPSEFDLRDARSKVDLAQLAIGAARTRLGVKQQTITQTRATASFDLESLRRAIEQTQLDVQNFESQMGDVKIMAPFAGKVTRLAARPGDTINAFFPVMNLSGLEGLVIKADIAEGDLPRIAAGMPVEMTMDAYPNVTLNGRIDLLPSPSVGQTGPAPERATRIMVAWPGPGAELGMLARVQVTLLIKPNVLMVPNGAVRTVGKRKFVEYMDSDIKRSRNVEVGISTDQDTEIVSGVQEGMIILAGQS